MVGNETSENNIRWIGETDDQACSDDLIHFASMPEVTNPLVVLPDIHVKRGEMSPTGAVLVSPDHVLPCFTHLTVGSGISVWKIANSESIDDNEFEKLFRLLSLTLPGKADGDARRSVADVDDDFIEKCFYKGAGALIDEGFLSETSAQHIENEGNYRHGLSNSVDPRDAIPERLWAESSKAFGTLGTGNAFFEIHKIDECYNSKIANAWGLKEGQLLLIVHSGNSAGLLNLYFTPRWGLHGDAFIPFEEDKWHYHASRLSDKETMALKRNYFPNAKRHFAIPATSSDGKLYLSAMAGLCNFATANRLWLGYWFDRLVETVTGSDRHKTSLLWDSVHDSIQEVTLPSSEAIPSGMTGKTVFVHRHGATPAYDSANLPADNFFSTTGQPVVLPTAPGRPCYLGSADAGIQETWFSACHGTGRVLDRPEALDKFSDDESINQILKDGCKLFGRANNLAGEHPGAFRTEEGVIKQITENNILKMVGKMSPKYIYKGSA